MNMGNYAARQPMEVQHMIYLSTTGADGNTGLARVMDKLCNAAPDGYCGGDGQQPDFGLVCLSALGFPIMPCRTNTCWDRRSFL